MDLVQITNARDGLDMYNIIIAKGILCAIVNSDKNLPLPLLSPLPLPLLSSPPAHPPQSPSVGLGITWTI